MFKFIDIPKYLPEEEYLRSIAAMRDQLAILPGIKSIYQIGSVSTPGISDIDMLVVVENDFVLDTNPIDSFQADQYLFTHELYGMPEKGWHRTRELTFFHNYKHLALEQLEEPALTYSKDDEQKLKQQIALEFLIKMYWVLFVQRMYKQLKVRSFLLEGKALLYDLEFLDIKEGKCYEAVKSLIELRTEWFELSDPFNRLQSLSEEMYRALVEILKELLNEHTFYLPARANTRLSRNTTLKRSQKLNINHKGIVPPGFGILPDEKFFNLLHRFNSFELQVPFAEAEKDCILTQRFDLLKELRTYNSKYLPHYLIPSSSLNVL